MHPKHTMKRKVYFLTNHGSVLHTDTPELHEGKVISRAEAREFDRRDGVAYLTQLARHRRDCRATVYVVRETARRVRLYLCTRDGEAFNVTASIARIAGLPFDGGNWLQTDPATLRESVARATSEVFGVRYHTETL